MATEKKKKTKFKKKKELLFSIKRSSLMIVRKKKCKKKVSRRRTTSPPTAPRTHVCKCENRLLRWKAETKRARKREAPPCSSSSSSSSICALHTHSSVSSKSEIERERAINVTRSRYRIGFSPPNVCFATRAPTVLLKPIKNALLLRKLLSLVCSLIGYTIAHVHRMRRLRCIVAFSCFDGAQNYCAVCKDSVRDFINSNWIWSFFFFNIMLAI